MAKNNNLILIGNLGDNPEVHQNQDGSSRTTLSIATTDSYKDGEEWKDLPTVWHYVTFFGQEAQKHANFYQKGQRVKIEGSLNYYLEEVNGKKRSIASIRGERIDAAPLPNSNKASSQADTPAPVDSQSEAEETDSIPF
ncbi:MAG: single-stranded DNA-binding protein [Cyanobacteria bacterium P01_A01_bin.83]